MVRPLTYCTRNPGHLPLSLSLTVLLAFTVIALVPAFLMLGRSIVVDGAISLQNYVSLFSDGRTAALLGRSMAMSLGAALLSLIFGIPLAVCLVKTSFFGKKVASVAYLLPLFIPPHIHALGWSYMLGEKGWLQLLFMSLLNTKQPICNIYSPAGAALILFLAYFPIFVLIVISGLSQVDRRMEETASFNGSPFLVYRKITLPLIRPHIISGMVFVFIFSFFNYGIPSMLRVPTYPVEIFARFSAFYDEASATALSTPLVAIALLLLLYQKKYMEGRSYVTIGTASRSAYQSVFKSRAAKYFVWSFLVLSVGCPLIALLIQAGSLQSFAVAWKTSYMEIITSVLLATLAATLCTTLGYFLALYLEEQKSWWKDIVNGLSLLPFAFPATLFGIGLIHLWNRSSTQFIYTSSAILIIAYIARFIPFAIRIITAGLNQISPGVKEAAIICRKSRWSRLLRIELPLVKKPLAICWIVIFIFSMGELGATLLVIPPGEGTLSLKIYTLMHYGAAPLVSALALILIGVNLLFSSALFWSSSK